jgi:excinuclease UvrABC helicase subunit UvrB
MRRKNFFNNWTDIDEVMRAFFSGEPQIPGINSVKHGVDENGNWKKETYSSNDGMIQITSFVRTSEGGERKKDTNSLESLKKQLQRAVQNQEFEQAVELRDKIKTLEQNKEKIIDLELQLKKAIDLQEFEKAIELRDELKKLK